jgi:hypothetical protein
MQKERSPDNKNKPYITKFKQIRKHGHYIEASGIGVGFGFSGQSPLEHGKDKGHPPYPTKVNRQL